MYLYTMDNRGVLRSFLICTECECVAQIVEKLKWDLWKKTPESGKFLYQIRPIICIRCTNDLFNSLADARSFMERYNNKKINIHVIENSTAASLIRKKYDCELTCHNNKIVGVQCEIEFATNILSKLQQSYQVEYPIQCTKHKLTYTIDN